MKREAPGEEKRMSWRQTPPPPTAIVSISMRSIRIRKTGIEEKKWKRLVKK
jgi:hypothetical protein